jgi:hypothetical protein
MKKISLLFVVVLLLSNSPSFCQTINLSLDSVKTLLCKKWEMSYALMGEMKIEKRPGAIESSFEFNKDGTFVLMSSKDTKGTNGTWSYDKNMKLIKLLIGGKNNSTIISLKEDEMILLADTKKATPDDPMEIKVVYKIKPN